MTELFFHFSFSQMLLCALLLIPAAKDDFSVKVFIALMYSACFYLISELVSPIANYSVLWWLGHIGGNALPGLFWLVCLSVFGDSKVIKKKHLAIASLTLIIPTVVEALRLMVGAEQLLTIDIYIKNASLMLELGLIGHGLYIAAKQWRDDLVQNRRYMRGGVISFAAVYIMLVIVTEQLLNITGGWIDLVESACLAALMLTINLLLFKVKPDSLFSLPSSVKINEPSIEQNSPELAKVLASMEQEKLYQQDGMTIAALAKHLAIHEYKLRNLINGELNYRNFNDFLNHYRIKEVSESLIKVEFKSTPVLTLALESGFRSLSSFNKAFKTIHGITPTEFRKKHLSEI